MREKNERNRGTNIINKINKKKCRAPPGDVKDKTKQYNNLNRIRPRSKGKDRKTEAQQKAPEAAAAVRVA